ncbi:hypothetical protein AD428_07650 [Achromobacter sp. DMS1]|nr:hypothetical protein AD428_07650 [Achromobacter sp. DMS1]
MEANITILKRCLHIVGIFEIALEKFQTIPGLRSTMVCMQPSKTANAMAGVEQTIDEMRAHKAASTQYEAT